MKLCKSLATKTDVHCFDFYIGQDGHCSIQDVIFSENSQKIKVDFSLSSVKIHGTKIGSLFAVFSENSRKIKDDFSLFSVKIHGHKIALFLAIFTNS